MVVHRTIARITTNLSISSLHARPLHIREACQGSKVKVAAQDQRSTSDTATHSDRIDNFMYTRAVIEGSSWHL